MPGRGSCKLYSPEALRVSEGTRPLPLAVDGRGFKWKREKLCPHETPAECEKAADVHAFGTFRELTVCSGLEFRGLTSAKL